MRKSGPAIAVPTAEMSVSIRKISNGYIVRRSGSLPKGGYVEHEEYMAKNPLMPQKGLGKPGGRSGNPKGTGR